MKRKTNRTDHYRIAKDKSITIAKTIYNRKPKKRQFIIAKRKANPHRATTNTKHKTNVNQNLCKTKAEQKKKHESKTDSEMAVSEQNKNWMKNLGFLSTVSTYINAIQSKHGQYRHGIQHSEATTKLSFAANTQETGFLPQVT